MEERGKGRTPQLYGGAHYPQWWVKGREVIRLGTFAGVHFSIIHIQVRKKLKKYICTTLNYVQRKYFSD
jgi:hypothetical protein